MPKKNPESSSADTYLPGASVNDLMAPAFTYEAGTPADVDIPLFRAIIVIAVGDIQISGVDGVSRTYPSGTFGKGIHPLGGIRLGAATNATVDLVRY